MKCHYLWGSTWLHMPGSEKALSIPSRAGEGQSPSLTAITPLAFGTETIALLAGASFPGRARGIPGQAPQKLTAQRLMLSAPLSQPKGVFHVFFFHYFSPLLASVLLGGARAALCWMQRKKKFPFSSCLPFVPTLCSTKLGNSWGLAAYRGKFIENTYFSPFSDTYFQKTFYRCQ